MNTTAPLAAANVPLADIVALGMFVLMFADRVVAWVKGVMGGTSKAVRDGERKAAADATDAATMKRLVEELGRLVSQLGELSSGFHRHEVECAEFKGAIAENHKQFIEAQVNMARSLESTQRQLQNWVMGLAPSPAEEIPANRPSRRRAAT